MKNYTILFIGFFFLLLSCEGETVYNPDDSPCPEGDGTIVDTGQRIKFTDTEGNWATNIDYENLSLIATDSLDNYLYAPNGVLIADLSNYVEVQKQYDENEQVVSIMLELGHVLYNDNITNTAKAYFLLKIDDNTFDKIIGYYDTECHNLLLTKISYNGVEYPATGTIEIVKEE